MEHLWGSICWKCYSDSGVKYLNWLSIMWLLFIPKQLISRIDYPWKIWLHKSKKCSKGIEDLHQFYDHDPGKFDSEDVVTKSKSLQVLKGIWMKIFMCEEIFKSCSADRIECMEIRLCLYDYHSKKLLSILLNYVLFIEDKLN